jgi:hypothetical protein
VKLILENWKRYINEISLGEPTPDIEYTAFVLEDNSKLLQYAPEGWKVHAHHMTIIPPTDMKRRLPAHWLEFSGCLEVVGIAQNDQIVAARVSLGDLPMPMKIAGLPHITIATNPEAGGKPAMSNALVEEDFQPISPIEVCGNVEEISRQA